MAKGILQGDSPDYPVGGRFDTVVQHVLGIEGGHVNDAADHGGETQFGISLRFLKVAGLIDANHDGFADFDLDFDGDIDGADVRQLTIEKAKALYYCCFWQRLGLDRLPQKIDTAVFDQAVNGGAMAAVKMLQTSLNRMHVAPGDLKVDGHLGRITIARVFTAQRVRHGDTDLLICYRQAAEARYNAIARTDHSQVIFLNGWIARARRLGDV